MKNIILVLLITVIVWIFANKFYDNYEYNKSIELYTVENLNSIIENSDLEKFGYNIYNINFTGKIEKNIYCNLNMKAETFLIKTYFYQFKDKISFVDFICKYGYSGFYKFTDK